MTIPLDLARIPFVAGLARFGNRAAVIDGDTAISYAELAGRVAAVADRLGTTRRLVALAAANDVDSLVGYLAALSGGHPLMVVPADKPAALESLLAAYDPDVVIRPGSGAAAGSGPAIEERRPGSRHELHPELALLMSTSGSTGSPKLVRLSQENVQANAESIAAYLGISADDRAATTLPMSYCYGLSVINSYLLRGAALVLTELSVVDPCFWELMRRHRVSSFAAVPYTFELLERVGFESMDLPALRYITQAGGRLAPEKVRHYAELGRRRGWELFVMYGQTEATARMAYLPPALAAENPSSIGVPVPGGSFRIEAVDGLEDGELVYTGPNVMLGYAQDPADLALGRTITELRTGDLARRQDNGLYRVVGRRSRFVKIVGLRIDLGQVETMLGELGVTAAAAGSDEKLVVAVEGEHDTTLLAKIVTQGLGLPRAALQMRVVPAIPRFATGKTDYPAVLALGAVSPDGTHDAGADDGGRVAGVGGPAVGGSSARAIFADALERDDIADGDTFVSLGGDSLSYVAASIRLEKALGYLPPDWHITPVRDLVPRKAPATPRRFAPAKRLGKRLFAPLESGILLRAVGIILIASTHIGLFHWEGAAHILMAVAGYNFARFQLSGRGFARFKRQLHSLGRLVIPAVAFIGVAFLLTDDYTVANIFLLNSIVGPEEVTTQWHFWFIEVLVYMLAVLAVLLAVPGVGKLERRFPFAFPLAIAGLALISRYDIVDPQIPHPMPTFWLFMFGWLVARAKTLPKRLFMSALVVLTVPGYFFGDQFRENTVIAGVLMLIWLPTLLVPVVLRRPLGLLASASLYIYLTHWLVFPLFAGTSPLLALLASLAAGVAYWAVSMQFLGLVERWLGRRRAAVRAAAVLEPVPVLN
ncbi:AMP-dependent synthetase [Arthrobacter sp. SW1]|uniref:AMP-binding protein n=1 Tax=Arthrobacter sp. SW1 TaxID=1920889 RepID=UPI000877D714|nr:AMP-binding protein [Arthrobacter sp. SW1]OFI39104.1 AMP-dependent synthetase [Arthrobacter sp. SW1]